jgi:hypothetical protein
LFHLDLRLKKHLLPSIRYPKGGIMIINIRAYTMAAKRSIIKNNASQYRRARKKQKTKMLNELTQVTRLHRKYLTHLINQTGKVYYTPQGKKLIGDPTVTYLHKRGRKKVYTEELIPYLETLWALCHFQASIYMVYLIRHNPNLLYQKPPDFDDYEPKFQRRVRKLLKAPESIKQKLLKISPATVDRLLRKVKRAARLTGRSKANPHASGIKKKIPVESYFDKPKDPKPGYMEVDLVYHCGEQTRGDYCHTLTGVDITTGWAELRVLRNRARLWTVQALDDINRSVPFALHTWHSDNGPEFLVEDHHQGAPEA